MVHSNFISELIELINLHNSVMGTSLCVIEKDYETLVVERPHCFFELGIISQLSIQGFSVYIQACPHSEYKVALSVTKQ